MASISSNPFHREFYSLVFNFTKCIENCIWKFKEVVSPTQVENLEEALFQFNAKILEGGPQEVEKSFDEVNVKLKTLDWRDQELVSIINQINVTFMSDQLLARHIDDKIWKSPQKKLVKELEKAFFIYNRQIAKNKSPSKIAAALKIVHKKLKAFD